MKSGRGLRLLGGGSPRTLVSGDWIGLLTDISGTGRGAGRLGGLGANGAADFRSVSPGGLKGAVGMMVCIAMGLNERIDDVGMLAPEDAGVVFS